MTRRITTIVTIGAAALWLSIAAWPVQAATCNTGRILPACACTGDCSANDFITMFINIAQLLLGIVGLLALLYFIAGGLDWITSGGNSDKVSSGRSKMTNAVVGLVIVISAWAIMNTVYYVFVGSNSVFGAKWFELKSLEDIAPPTTPPPTGFGTGEACDPAVLALQYNSPRVPAGDSPEVIALRECMVTAINEANPDVLGKMYTYEVGDDSKSNPLCNYTRGDESNPCTPVCAHEQDSCHYGGSNGTTGAMAIDFNAAAGYTEEYLAGFVRNAANGPCAALRGYMQAPEPPERNHSHVSAAGCNTN